MIFGGRLEEFGKAQHRQGANYGNGNRQGGCSFHFDCVIINSCHYCQHQNFLSNHFQVVKKFLKNNLK